MRNYKERGIVLHSIRYGESGLVVYLLTRGHGRMTYMVGGVRSASSKGNKAAFFQPMFPVEFEGLERPGAEMHRMRDLRSPAVLRSVPFDSRKSAITLFMAEVVYRLVREVEPNAPLYDFLESSVLALDGMEEGIANFHLWFLVRLSAFIGFHPGNEYLDGGWFDIAEGLFSARAPSHALALAPRNAELLHLMMEADAAALAAIPLSGQRRSEFLTGMLAYLGYHLDAVHNIRSVEILKEIF
ncbi:DNA repair protein RecO [Bacteroidia bacterium]|nr:DNA repair protein RecO [Bacteroidia bacterium]